MDLKRLEGKLENNYNGIVDRDIEQDVFGLMEENPDPSKLADHSGLFVKKYGKVAEHLIDDGCEFTCEQLQWLDQYYRVGINNLLSEGPDNSPSRNNTMKMLGHMYSHNGKIKRMIGEHYQGRERTEWLEKSIQDFERCVEICEEFDPEHGIYQYAFIAELYRQLGASSETNEEKIFHYKKGYEKMMASVEKSRKVDGIHHIFQYFFLASHATDIFELSDKKEEKIYWLGKASEAFSQMDSAAVELTNLKNGHHHALEAKIYFELYRLAEEKDKKREMALKSYNTRKKAQMVFEESGDEESKFQSGFLGDLSLQIGNLTDDEKKKEWYEKGCKYLEDFLSSDIEIPEKIRASRLSNLAQGYLARSTDEKQVGQVILFLENAYENFQRAAELNPEKKFRAFQLSRMGEISHKLADLTDDEEKKIELLKKAHEDYGRSIEDTVNFSKEQAGHQSTFKADIASRLAGLLENERQFWLESSYEDNICGAGLVKPYDERHWAITMANAGRNAAEIHQMTRSDLWKERAIEAYSFFMNYYIDKKDSELHSIYVKIESIVRKLQGKSSRLKRRSKKARKQEKVMIEKGKAEKRESGKKKKSSGKYKRKKFDWREEI